MIYQRVQVCALSDGLKILDFEWLEVIFYWYNKNETSILSLGQDENFHEFIAINIAYVTKLILQNIKIITQACIASFFVLSVIFDW